MANESEKKLAAAKAALLYGGISVKLSRKEKQHRNQAAWRNRKYGGGNKIIGGAENRLA